MFILLWCALFPFYLPIMEVYYVYQFIVAILILLYSFLEIGKLSGRFFLILYPIIVVISCLINNSTILITQVLRGITYALLMMDVFAFIHLFIRLRKSNNLIKLCYMMSKIYAFMNIVWILVLCISGNISDAVNDEFLFSRGKFSTAYIFLFNLLFFCLAWRGNVFFSKKYKKQILVLLSLGYICICAVIQTATGIIVITLFLVLILIPGNLLKIVGNPIVLILLIIESMILMLFLEVILSNPIFQNLVVNILHEDLTLTGRLQLYSLLPPLIMKSGFFGSGFGSYVAAKLAYHGWYNAQNGLVEIILTYGFLGAGSFLSMVYTSAVHGRVYLKPLNATIFIFCIVAIVEIPFGVNFVLLLSLLMNIKKEEIGDIVYTPKLVKFSLRWRKIW